MAWAAALLLAGMFIFAGASRNYKKSLFRKLDRKKHPLKILYPAASRITDLFTGNAARKKGTRIEDLMKSLCVKENVETEIYLYRVRKCSVVVLTMICAGLCVMITGLVNPGPVQVRSLQRGEYGQGVRNYDLEVDFQDEEEKMHFDVDQVKPDESHIIELFENSRDAVYRQMLGENPSAQEVSKPLNFISSYNGIRIFWNIEDNDLVGYNGNVSYVDENSEQQPVNIYATFMLEDVSEIFNFPVMLVSPVLSEREKLQRRILEEIEKSSSLYSREVDLPEELDGEKISFYTVPGNSGFLILILAAASVIAILLFYDKKLEKNVNERKEQLMMDFSRIVSKLSLLYEAGLSVHGAFERIVSDHERNVRTGKKQELHKRLLSPSDKNPSDYAYLEMKLALEKIKNGESEGRAYAQFGRRCALQPYIKLGNLLERNLSKGTKGMQDLLKDEVDHAYERRKRLARKKGEQASTKMLIPMTMMLVVVIAIIAFPALLSIGM